MKHLKMFMINKIIVLFSIALSMLIATTCTRTEKQTSQIFLYGEGHGVERIMNKQLEIWHEYYHQQKMRHLFIEFPYFTAEYFNIWMQSDSDDILEELFNEWAGTLAHNPNVLAFFKAIKSKFPETIFHGVDVGHGFYSTGERFLQYLQDNNMQDTERHLLTLEAIKQGEIWQKNRDDEFRENAMAENFIREFDKLGNQNVMGIFGSVHASFGNMGAEGYPDVKTLAERLKERYGRSVNTTDMTIVTWHINPIKTEIVSINGKDYVASYFGTDFTAFRDIVSMSYWRLENAYDDFKGKPANRDILPIKQYPMKIERKQVFFVDAELSDGAVNRSFYRSDMNIKEKINGKLFKMPITTGFNIE